MCTLSSSFVTNWTEYEETMFQIPSMDGASYSNSRKTKWTRRNMHLSEVPGVICKATSFHPEILEKSYTQSIATPNPQFANPKGLKCMQRDDQSAKQQSPFATLQASCHN